MFPSLKSNAARFRRIVPALLTCFSFVALLLAYSGNGIAGQARLDSSLQSATSTQAPQAQQSSQAASSGNQNAAQQSQAPTDTNKSPLPRGKKLILKDGSVQLVREYQVMEDKVRFYSTERSQWEEMPTALIDWDATHQAEKAQKQGDAELNAKVHKQEQIRRVMALDVDASLEAAPGVFIPPGEGIFVYDGKKVLRLTQAQAQDKVDKAKVVEQVLVPIPVVPSRHNLTIHRAHSEVRVKNEQPEFYMRTADAREPDLLLIHAKVRGESRLIENVDTYFGAVQRTKRNEIEAQRWLIAPGVYRFTINESLEPGEYVFTELVKGQGTNLYVWDFGVDEQGKPAVTDKKSEK
jgi:hypothetical protein